VLVLSEFAGAASQLADGALLVNPYDILGVAGAIARACEMPAEERQRRMARLRRNVFTEDVHWWVDEFLDHARDDRHAPGLAPIVPQGSRDAVEGRSTDLAAAGATPGRRDNPRLV
ncbi:MAG TPA: trehalose-6-phosphate synthase, partial [Thermoanaerobaculia bacterium]